MDFEVRAVTDEEYGPWARAVSLGWGNHPIEEDIALWRPTLELDRTVGAFDHGKPVGGLCSIACEMMMPGGSLPVAGVTNVAVQPTHRRRGMLTVMMAHQLRDIHRRGEALAGLFASEGVIYGRFGYGTGTMAESWTIDRRHTAFAREHEQRGSLDFVEPGEMRRLFPGLFRQATINRPGAIQRPAFEWDVKAADPVHHRGGSSAFFHVVYEEGGKATGYASYRLRGDTLVVSDLMATTDEAHASLWRYCFGVDLRSTTKASTRPVDDPLPWMLADRKRLERSLHHGLWLRLVDVAEALACRRYSRDGRLVFEVHDSFCPWNEGLYELEGGPGGAECRRSDATPDLELSVTDLATAYLGTVPFTTLYHAGAVEERRAGSLALADAMFAPETQPWCPTYL